MSVLRDLLILTLTFTVLISAVQGKESGSEIPQEWKETTLSAKTLEKVNSAVEAYQRCLNEETRKHIQDAGDSRHVTDLILGVCDSKLAPAKAAFDSEKVPGVISDHYLRRKRSHAAQQVVREVMGAQALRYRETHP